MVKGSGDVSNVSILLRVLLTTAPPIVHAASPNVDRADTAMDELRAGASYRGLGRQQLRLRRGRHAPERLPADERPRRCPPGQRRPIRLPDRAGAAAACSSSPAASSLCPAPRRGTGLAARGSGFGRGSRGVNAARNDVGGEIDELFHLASAFEAAHGRDSGRHLS